MKRPAEKPLVPGLFDDDDEGDGAMEASMAIDFINKLGVNDNDTIPALYRSALLDPNVYAEKYAIAVDDIAFYEAKVSMKVISKRRRVNFRINCPDAFQATAEKQKMELEAEKAEDTLAREKYLEEYDAIKKANPEWYERVMPANFSVAPATPPEFDQYLAEVARKDREAKKAAKQEMQDAAIQVMNAVDLET